MFNKLIFAMVILLNSNLANSTSNEISIGIAVKENKYIADIKKIVTQAYNELDKTVIWKNLPTSRSLRSSFEQVLFKSKKLEDVTGHHYINKKHKNLVSSLEEQFSKRSQNIKTNSKSISDLVKNNKHIKQLDF